MDKSDKIIKEALKNNMKKIDDASFTKRIVNLHLSEKRQAAPMPFMNFASLIAGLSFVLLSIGLILAAQKESIVTLDIEINQEQGIILLIVSILFLIYKWAEEFLMLKLYKK